MMDIENEKCGLGYKLLTPGPLTTTDTVKKEMLFDHCTWDDDYKRITLDIRKKLLELAQVSEKEYTVVLMQGSGTFGVESVLTSVVGDENKLLIVANGAYGERMEEIAEHAKVPYTIYREMYNQVPDAQKIAGILDADKEITHVAMVHSETTSGILNDVETVGKVVQERGLTMIVDAMSSFGGMEIPVKEWGIDFIISSANKCIQGVPGFSFIIANKEKLIQSKGKARSLSLDLYSQWETMNKDGKWRFTSPTHVVLAFAQALKELEEEGGIPARSRRYADNNRLLISKLGELGIRPYIGGRHQGPIITTFFYPENHRFSFQEMYDYMKERGYAIYPGKVTEADTFRIGNIGEIYKEDIQKVAELIKEFLEQKDMGGN
ncbi:2-aminoethylphosphonate--pyruvate transaminase [Dorea acetigenes]|uniref:2-aminoethylphosphonate--pyruvate transaminase n=1 Tax=Dorea acetigenes TaxID=2981787 RepID=A0ABT2RR17_9FIRM|nr:2-aminoethylphosphonate--pyruvate transaminase [Dorea acetigenes]MCB6415666.1 2-aminoethylphosphonate--pyruvate transaminase [Faecalimonas umbilicata]MCU6687857.1 2-aminoethylphosphonate--pyruvate transaminase [Dorea acetigenes]SCJ58681.1 2-aminoethylphosphonate--pyruvate transaminase [uncultured Clostridium sp.]